MAKNTKLTAKVERKFERKLKLIDWLAKAEWIFFVFCLEKTAPNTSLWTPLWKSGVMVLG